MNKYLWRIFAISSLFLFGEAGANSYRQITLEDRVKLSQLVVVAEVSYVVPGACFERGACAKLAVYSSLKGEAVDSIWVQYGDSSIVENQPACCTVGQIAIFFLKHEQGGFFSIVGGRSGVHGIERP